MRVVRAIGFWIFALVVVGIGAVALAVAVEEALDARAFRTAEACGATASDDCIAEEPAFVADKYDAPVRDRNDSMHLGPRRREVGFVDRDDFERLEEGDRVVARVYRGRDIALVHEGRELRTSAHPHYAWGTSLAFGYWFTSFGGFFVWALAVTRGRIEDFRRSGRRLAKAGPFFVLPGGALLLAAPFDPTATVLGVLTALAAAVTVGGAIWTAARAR